MTIHKPKFDISSALCFCGVQYEDGTSCRHVQAFAILNITHFFVFSLVNSCWPFLVILLNNFLLYTTYSQTQQNHYLCVTIHKPKFGISSALCFGLWSTIFAVNTETTKFRRVLKYNIQNFSLYFYLLCCSD